MTNYLQQILTYFRNLTLNATGVNRDLYRLLQDSDIDRALMLMQERDDEVDIAIKEYNPQTHDIMRRPNKYVKGEMPYITEKLPRTRQRYINEVELFFLLGNPIVWKKDDGDDGAFKMFTDFLDNQHFNSRIRQAKRLAGAETESAILTHIDRDEANQKRCKTVVLARSTGYRLRPLFDQYGNMTAFAYGYVTKQNGRAVQHWDFQTSEFLVYSQKSSIGWDVSIYPNPTKKINVIYFIQPKAWDGAEMRLAREEMLDSKTADTNNYFADPIATATADVISSMVDPNKPGKLIQLAGSKSSFQYVNPPQSSQTRDAEKSELQKSILFDTFTPDFDVQNMKGFGTLSGVAIRNAMILGYIKRANRMEVYGELVNRYLHLAIATLKFLHPEKAAAFDSLKISFNFAEPFEEDVQQRWSAVSQLYSAKLVSLETAVTMLALTDAPMEEMSRILATADAAQKGPDGQQAQPTQPAEQTPPAGQENQEN